MQYDFNILLIDSFGHKRPFENSDSPTKNIGKEPEMFGTLLKSHHRYNAGFTTHVMLPFPIAQKIPSRLTPKDQGFSPPILATAMFISFLKNWLTLPVHSVLMSGKIVKPEERDISSFEWWWGRWILSQEVSKKGTQNSSDEVDSYGWEVIQFPFVLFLILSNS